MAFPTRKGRYDRRLETTMAVDKARFFQARLAEQLGYLKGAPSKKGTGLSGF